MAASVAGGGALFTLAAIAFLASLSPTTFPLILVAIGLALLGFLCAVAPPVAEFFL